TALSVFYISAFYCDHRDLHSFPYTTLFRSFNMAIAETDIISAKIRPNFSLSNESIQLLQTSEFAPNTSWYNNHNRQVMWQISKPIQIAGQRKNKIAVADNNLLYTKSEYRETERQLFFEVAEKWLSVQAVQKQ